MAQRFVEESIDLRVIVGRDELVLVSSTFSESSPHVKNVKQTNILTYTQADRHTYRHAYMYVCMHMHMCMICIYKCSVCLPSLPSPSPRLPRCLPPSLAVSFSLSLSLFLSLSVCCILPAFRGFIATTPGPESPAKVLRCRPSLSSLGLG